MSDEPSAWERNKRVALAVLHDRAVRRRWIARLLLAVLLWMAIGLWGIHDWLEDDRWRFVAWWGMCGCGCVFLLLFALYDGLRVMGGEEAGKD